jgi:hypothetical protein
MTEFENISLSGKIIICGMEETDSDLLTQINGAVQMLL